MRLLVVVLGGLLTLTLWLFFAGWGRLAWTMSIHGWIAMGIGVAVSLALGGGLMALSFFSSRHGYDDRLPPPPEPGSEHSPGGSPEAP